MDPETTLDNFVASIRSHELVDACEAVDGLCSWLAKGGFRPSWTPQERIVFAAFADSTYFSDWRSHQLHGFTRDEKLAAVIAKDGLELFFMSTMTIDDLPADSPFRDQDTGQPLPGFYFWACFPGCLPDSDPSGPYEMSVEAVAAAFDDWDLWDTCGLDCSCEDCWTAATADLDLGGI